jgi:hypothetical protein
MKNLIKLKKTKPLLLINKRIINIPTFDRTIFVENYIELICINTITKYKYSMFTEFLPFLVKKGKKLFIINIFLKSISKLFNNIINNNIIDNSYFFLEHFSFFYKTDKNIKNLNYLLDWYYKIYNPIFDIKCFNSPKIQKNTKNTYKILFVPEKFRSKIISKHIISYINNNNNIGINNRINIVFSDLLFNFKKSFLFKRKLSIYRKLISLK